MSASRARTGGKTGKTPSAQKVTPEPTPAGVLSPTADGEGPQTTFPIVGIGASAGGLAAFEAFFSGMPSDVDPGMAFVLVQHLAPDHKSILADLIRRYTRMQVFEVEDGMAVRPNCAYIIPPNCDMAFLDGTLHLLDPSAPRGQRLPIDFFFSSLAHHLRERAIGIVLSGTGSDGTLGVRAIKGEGGMVMAQAPESTEFDGMPRCAIATGLVDYEMLPAQMPGQLIAYATHAYGRLSTSGTVVAPQAENARKKIFVLLRAQTGHDFSGYKPSTIHRRIARRMALQQVETMDGYVRYLQQTPAEIEALFRDLLIGVTSFFRDPDAFQRLAEDVIPQLFVGKTPNSVIRVWSAGCSTGEEAYSLAILLQERMEALHQGYTVQLFATDIDPEAIAKARVGIYPASSTADITPERLARFFAMEPGGTTYRIHKGIRDMLVFSEQDLIKDPPFSKLDLICCRNLLIYLGAELQKRILPLFHYALKPGGFLFLGTSESIGEQSGLFTVVDRKTKLYRRAEDLHQGQRAALARFVSPMTAIGASLLSPAGGKKAFPVKIPLRELTEQALLQQIAPVGALVSGQGDILYLHGRTGLYLEPASGEAGVSNILTMAREGLRLPLATSLRRAALTRETVRAPGLRVKTNGEYTSVNLCIRPVTTGLTATPTAPLYLVILEDVASADASTGPRADTTGPASDEGESLTALRQELRAKDEYLQSANEELESSGEELKSANEEMQSVNEELQSTNEELETSREELQSVNEELLTVNNELLTKVTDLSRSNNDMNNLLSGTGVGTVFVDHHLRILRFTPAASEIINLLPADVGRPVAHIVSNLVGYSHLMADVQSVLDTLIPKEAEVQTTKGQWFRMRLFPYRTLDNAIEGAVLSFVEITEIVAIRDALRTVNDELRLAVVARDAHDAITVQDLEGRIIAWNPGATRMYGWSEAEALAMNARERMPDALREDALAKAGELSRAVILQPYRTQRLTKAGAVVEVWMTATALVNEAGQMYAIATTERASEPTDNWVTARETP